MRILNNDDNQAVSNITLFLTPAEAKEALHDLEALLRDNRLHHLHINDKNYEREITLTIITEANLKLYDERSKRLILDE